MVPSLVRKNVTTFCFANLSFFSGMPVAKDEQNCKACAGVIRLGPIWGGIKLDANVW